MPADVKTSLPQLDLAPGATITVSCDDPGAVITSLVIHGYETPPNAGVVPLPPLLAYSPGNA